MDVITLSNLTVLGGGVLGGQIAWHSAFKGKSVVVYDAFAKGLENCRASHDTYASIYKAQLGATQADIDATRERLTYTEDLAHAVAVADLVIEAVPEIPDIKLDIYRKMAPLLNERALVATNSSTFLPRDFADATGRPGKFCALHFANMIWSLNMVEVMAHSRTDPSTLAAVTQFAIDIGQVPVPVRKEQNGYVLNSWLVPLLTASLSLVVNEVATPEDVDRTFMIFNRGCSMGPFGLIDMVGMKTVYDVSAYWGHERKDAQMLSNAEFVKSHFLDVGKMGLSSNEGFYTYPDPKYSAPDFLNVPSPSAIPDIVELASLRTP